MKKLSIGILAVLCLAFSSCKEEEPSTDLIVNLGNTGLAKIEVSNIEKGLFAELEGAVDTLNLDTQSEMILNIVNGRSVSYVHIKPGTQVVVDTLSMEPLRIGQVGEASKENDYLVTFDQLKKEAEDNFSMRDIAVFGVDTFQTKIQEKYAPLRELTQKINGDAAVSAGFKALMSDRMNAAEGNSIINYDGWHNYLNGSHPELPADFYAVVEQLDFTKGDMLSFGEARDLAEYWHTKDLKYDDYENDVAYFAAIKEQARKVYGNTPVGDYCTYRAVTDDVNYGSGIDGSTASVKAFKAATTNAYLLSKLDKTLAPWMNLKAGLAAPDFRAMNRAGEAVKLSDLKGKKVYVDVWATWCGPCIREIPSLKTLESDLHKENIEFVSVSIDKADDKQKWMDMVAEKELKGVQLMAEGDWKSDVAKGYNITGIPRFLLIDENGRIASANAPRPSDPNIKEVLMK